MEFSDKYKQTYKMVLKEIENALMNVDVVNLERLSQDILDADKVFFIGVGRVMLSLEAMAKRLTHLGISAHCVGSVNEPAITERDLLIVGSGSGASIVPLAIAKKAKQFSAKIVHIGSNPNSEMKDIADYMVRVPVQTRLYLSDEIKSCQIMTSLFEQTLLIIGDVVAQMIVEERAIDVDDLWEFHANLE